jgi:subtilisin family serine protease
VKKRKHSRRQTISEQTSGWLGWSRKRAKRARSTWTFELLEDRHYFTAAPFTGLEGLQYYTVSNSTAEGQQLVDALAELWALEASAGNTSGTVDAAVRAIPTDPALQYQWHLFNVGQSVTAGQFQDLFGVPGQDANVVPAWDAGYTGNGVNVAVVDTAIQTNHPDLAGNISLQYAYNALNGSTTVVQNATSAGAAHGTAVAGIIGAVANNGLGGVGVAYGASIVPITLLPSGVFSPPMTTDAIVRAINANGAPIDIFNHSWGPPDAGGLGANRGVDAVEVPVLIALTNSARHGRDGLGAIHVWAAGNGAEFNDSAGSDGYVNSRYTIAVGIVDHDGQIANSDGTATNYGEMAPSVLIVAPSASGPTDIIHNFDTGSGIFTTDLTNGGINVPPVGDIEFDIDTYPDTNYTSRFGGTSAAAPVVSGVIALMLEANPNLTYRDVEEILVRSARQNDDVDVSWITNAVAIFRDPLRHFGDELNDEIEYIILPGEITTPAMQAATSQLTSANGATFSIHARPGGGFDGAAGNDVSVAFVSVAGPPGVIAVEQNGVITITVSGTPTWGEIQQAVNGINGGNDFGLIFDDPADASILFNPADMALTGQLSGGANAEGEEPEAVPVDPFYNPIFDPRTQPLPDSLWTNGAGYTVSHGRGINATEYGYAHGVVDATLAVQLARQWHLKDQNLPGEKTWIAGGFGGVRIRSAQATNDESGEFLIPGGLTNASEGYIEYFNEFFKEPTVEEGEEEDDPETPVDETLDTIDPDSLPFNGDDPPVNNRGQHITVPVPAIDVVTGASNVMSIEWVEVQLDITGPADAMNYLRVTLVSPDGTHSELTQNHYRPADINKSFQLGTLASGVFVGFGDSITPVDENGTNSDRLSWVYSTNRHWGERSDSKPIVNEDGWIEASGDFGQGWELHFENYSSADFSLNGAAIAFHGSPIGSPAGPVERVMGKVGADTGAYITAISQLVGAQDGFFNFDRAPVAYFDPVTNALQFYSEKTAGNVVVYAIDNSTGQRVAEFVTGADGNYYFDLPAGEYTIGIEDPLGRTAIAAGPDYDSQWVITVDTTDGLTRTAGETHFDVLLDENGDPVLDPFGEPILVEFVVEQYNNLNFLLDPGSLPPSQVIYTGQVVGDLNGDGTQDAEDIGVFNFTVYADLNHTGQFEIGEPFALTDLDGNYTLNVPTATPNTFTIGVKAPTGWETSFPASKFHNDYSLPGEQVDGLRFLVQPPSDPSGEGNGTIFGFVIDDKNGNGLKDVNEKGLAGATVYIDANLNGEYDDGEIKTTTTSTGAYQFGEVIIGEVRLDVIVNEPFTLKAPSDGYIDLSLAPGQVSKNNVFALQNLATHDYGDLIGPLFDTENAKHFVSSGFRLGASIDAEVRPRYLIKNPAFDPDDLDPNIPEFIVDEAIGDGEADDTDSNEASFDDEDGVELLGGVLRPGANTFSISVTGVGGYLQGWIDWNNDGTFSTGEQIITNADLVQGTHQFVVNAPATLPGGQKLAARFRWGSIDIGFTGTDSIGEIEDYYFDTKVPILGDYNADDVVDNTDYQLWKSTFGSITDLRADGNKDGRVDAADYSVWRDNMGATGSGSGGAAALVAASLSTPEALISTSPVVVVSLSEQTLVTPSLVALGEGPAVVASSAVRIAAEPVVELSTVASSSTSGGAAIELVPLQFTASVGHAVDAFVASNSFAEVTARADLAMLLLATGNLRSDSAQDADEMNADLQWLNADEDQDAELESVLAAAFEEEIDWRGVA